MASELTPEERAQIDKTYLKFDGVISFIIRFYHYK